jgi:hypothetical protein
MEYFNKLGVFNLYELLKYGLPNFKDRLLKEWDNILYFDNTINVNEKTTNKYNNPNYWSGLIDNGQKSLFNKNRKSLNNLIKNNPKNTKQQLAKKMSNKIDELNIKSTQIDTLYLGSVCTPSKESVCIITGFNISMQRGDSKLLSHTGIKHYKKHNHKLYKQLENLYLTSNWSNSNDEVRIKEIAHNIRNKYYNKKIDNKQLIFNLAS